MGLSGQVVRAVSWRAGTKVVQQAVQLLLSIFLMRLLGPDAFGLMGMILVFSGFATTLTELGLGSALVHRQELREEHSSSAFWIIMAMHLSAASLLFCGAGLIADFYREPTLGPISRWTALTFVLNAPAAVPRALLQKELRFDVLAKVDVVALLASAAICVAVAMSGGGVWSLVVQQIISAAVGSSLLLALSTWKPRMLWSTHAARELWGYGAGLTGFNIVNYWARSADKLLIGRLLGVTALGLYSRAYSLMLLPITQIISVIGPVMLPALSTIQRDTPRIRRAFLRLMTILSFICFPLMLGLCIVARPFVLAVLGPKWIDVIPLIQILALVGITQTLCNPAGWIYTSVGRTDWLFWWGLSGSTSSIIVMGIAASVGDVKTVAAAYLFRNLLLTGPCLAIPGRLIGMSLGDVWGAIRTNVLCTVAMGVCVFVTMTYVLSEVSAAPQLIGATAIGVVSFLACAYALQSTALAELQLIRRHLFVRSVSVATPDGAIL